MEISGAIIRDKFIQENTLDNFIAIYKGKEIKVSTEHGFGKPKHSYLKRYDISVVDLKSGMLDVYTYEDCHSMQDAIKYALKGACLIK